jgi:hypothetical protein
VAADEAVLNKEPIKNLRKHLQKIPVALILIVIVVKNQARRMSSIIFKRSNRNFILKCNSKIFNNFENHQLVYEKTDLISKTIKEYYYGETFPTIH